jgi:shikimate dehydrogenase
MDETLAFHKKIFCIISNQRVFRSKSPEMFNSVLNRSGIDGAYVPFHVHEDNLGKALQSLAVLNIAGANISAPFKEKVMPYMDVLSEGANIIGAVNTIVCKNNQLKGYNTNAIGVMDALNEANFDIDGKKALIVGTGGAARAVAFILNWLRAEEITVTGRNDEKSRCLAEDFSGRARPVEDLLRFPLDVDLIVNATYVSSPDESEPLTELTQSLQTPGCQLVFDLNYGRRENIWEALAKRMNCVYMDGQPALAYQARRTFLLWTGRDIPPDEFLKALS